MTALAGTTTSSIESNERNRGATLPSPETAKRACRLLKKHSGLDIRVLIPTSAQVRKLAPDVRAGLEIRLMQALILALDAAVTSAGRGKKFFVSMVWDALASRWSPTYLQEVARGPARWSREFGPKAGRATDRDLARNGLYLEPFLKVAKNGCGLYATANDRGFVVAVNYDTDLWREFEAIIDGDEEYRRHRETSRLRLVLADAETTADRRRLLPAGDDEWAGAWGAYKVASGFAYDIAKVGPRKIRAMEVFERTIVYLDVATFVADVDKLDAKHRKIMRNDFGTETAWRRARKEAGPAWLKTDGRLNSWRAIREQLRTTTLDEGGQVAIRSNYITVINGRFQNLDFWLPDVPSKYRVRWFRMATRSGDRLPPVGRDISSSQLWVLAVLLGDAELEAMLKRGSFWKLAARRLWSRHKDRLIALGFTGPTDQELVASCKNAVMTHLYGSPLTEVAKRLAEDSEEFGPGLDVATIKLLIADPDLHLAKILRWFLPACRKMARVAHQMSPTRGFTFIEPVDRVIQVWNPLRTKERRIAGNSRVEIYGEVPVRQVPVPVRDPRTGDRVRAHDMYRLAGRPGGMRKGDALEGIFMGLREAKVPGHKPELVMEFKDLQLVSADGTRRDLKELKMTGATGHEYPAINIEDGDLEVWLKKLESRMAPCLAHMADTDFCVGVTEELTARSVVNIVPIHDGWYVPADDAAALEPSIQAAGERFLKDLGPSIIDAFERYLGNDKQYGPEVVEMAVRWDVRVKMGDWPKFRSNPTEPEK